ncbi:hypothetical protein CYMTET_17552 [Cymbomonas tetramitiformis]|uniref:Uncharacterized protein n=1 Tax=Cymbomonas tetramitiformis TaxID=36881 RepID=A0AAE0G9V9_9CHLO|nr:hypothetical protein CYMTET_17552 [Cymbomonas tetramitiformis]
MASFAAGVSPATPVPAAGAEAVSTRVESGLTGAAAVAVPQLLMLARAGAAASSLFCNNAVPNHLGHGSPVMDFGDTCIYPALFHQDIEIVTEVLTALQSGMSVNVRPLILTVQQAATLVQQHLRPG